YPISIEKPSLQIQNVVITSCQFGIGSYSADITINNSAIVAAPANTYLIEVFCGNNTMPFDSVIFNSAIAANGTATNNFTFTPPFAPVCVTGDHVTYRISPITTTNDTQCLCSPTMFISSEVLPVKLVSFEV